MSNKNYKRRICFLVEIIKWLGVIVLLVFASVGSYVYRDSNLFYRLLTIPFIVICSGYLASLTGYGRWLLNFSREAYQEIRKVVWPTFREGLYITLVVILVTIVMSLVLWGLDSILVYMVSLSLRL